MKNCLTVFLFACISCQSFGQIEWVNDDDERAEEIITYRVSNQGHHIINFTHRDSDSDFASIYYKAMAIDAQGNEVFNQPLPLPQPGR